MVLNISFDLIRSDSDLSALCGLYKSVLAVHHHRFEEAQRWIESTRKALDTTLGALVGYLDGYLYICKAIY
jgi:hypothetical protein